MAIDALTLESTREPPQVRLPPVTRHHRWVSAITLLALFAVASGYATGNEVQANTQFDQTHASLVITERRLRAVLTELSTVRHQLDAVTVEVFLTAQTLAQDSSALDSAKAALASAQVDLSHQTTTIADLTTCLDGVQQAVNALAVADVTPAITALNAVSANCSRIVTADG